MRNSRLEFCEQIVSKCNRNAFRLQRKAFEISNFLVAGGRSAPLLLSPTPALLIPFNIELDQAA